MTPEQATNIIFLLNCLGWAIAIHGLTMVIMLWALSDRIVKAIEAKQ